MATSGTVGQTVLDLASILDHAFRRCKIPAAKQTPENIELARENLYLFLSESTNFGLNLWCIDKQIVGLLQHREAYALTVGTVDTLEVFLRTAADAGGTLTATGILDTSPITDNNILTYLTLSSTSDYLLWSFSSTTAIRTVGILHQGTAYRTLAFDTSQDNVTWTNVYTTPVQYYSDLTWYWWDIDPARSALYFRIRDTNAIAALSAYEVRVSSSTTEIECARMNRDEYTSLPNKVAQGRPLQYWLDRQSAAPVLRVWRSPNNIYDHLVVWRRRQVQDVGDLLTNTIEVPQRWQEAIIANLAHRLSIELPEIDPKLSDMLKTYAEQALARVEMEEVDNSPIRILPRISQYTRRR